MISALQEMAANVAQLTARLSQIQEACLHVPESCVTADIGHMLQHMAQGHSSVPPGWSAMVLSLQKLGPLYAKCMQTVKQKNIE